MDINNDLMEQFDVIMDTIVGGDVTEECKKYLTTLKANITIYYTRLYEILTELLKVSMCNKTDLANIQQGINMYVNGTNKSIDTLKAEFAKCVVAYDVDINTTAFDNAALIQKIKDADETIKELKLNVLRNKDTIDRINNELATVHGILDNMAVVVQVDQHITDKLADLTHELKLPDFKYNDSVLNTYKDVVDNQFNAINNKVRTLQLDRDKYVTDLMQLYTNMDELLQSMKSIGNNMPADRWIPIDTNIELINNRIRAMKAEIATETAKSTSSNPTT